MCGLLPHAAPLAWSGAAYCDLWRDHVARAWSAGYYYTRRGLVRPFTTEVTAHGVVMRPIATCGVVWCGLVRPRSHVAWSDAAYCDLWRDRVARAWSAGYYYTRRGLVRPFTTQLTAHGIVMRPIGTCGVAWCGLVRPESHVTWSGAA